jgi:hypothetical protein
MAEKYLAHGLELPAAAALESGVSYPNWLGRVVEGDEGSHQEPKVYNCGSLKDWVVWFPLKVSRGQYLSYEHSDEES